MQFRIQIENMTKEENEELLSRLNQLDGVKANSSDNTKEQNMFPDVNMVSNIISVVGSLASVASIIFYFLDKKKENTSVVINNEKYIIVSEEALIKAIEEANQDD